MKQKTFDKTAFGLAYTKWQKCRCFKNARLVNIAWIAWADVPWFWDIR